MVAPPRPASQDRYWLHITLFLVTLASTIYAGGLLVGRFEDPLSWGFIVDGLRYGLSLLLFLTVHEFGHYFAARYHNVDTSLPYYIPIPLFGVPILNFGTLGAVIRIREPVPSTRKLYDIGVAGPVAGFVVAFGILVYGLATLPGLDYVMDFPGHEALKDYVQKFQRFPERPLNPLPETLTLMIGQTPLYWILTQFVDNVPPMFEMYHYPYLFAGWLGLFFTALNLLPVGQLDGGHVMYSLVGPKWHGRIARAFVTVLLISGSIGFMSDTMPQLRAVYPLLGSASWFILAVILYYFLNRIFDGNHRLIAPILLGIMAIVVVAGKLGPLLAQFGWTGWLFWCLLIVLVIKVDHPPVLKPEKLTPGRKALAICSIIIFFLCFSLRPIYIA